MYRFDRLAISLKLCSGIYVLMLGFREDCMIGATK
jgi:hypothetical protein